MGLSDITDREAVENALRELDELGRDAFLERYGFRPSRRFYVEVEGKLYDSKAILGAAHGIQFPDQGPLAHSEFSGGEATTAKKLRDLGFTVTSITPESEDDVPTLSELLAEVFELQHTWSSQNTPEMQQWRIVQFHPSYSYESFVEGLRPIAHDGAITFERVDGAVLRMAKAARLNDSPHMLIIDELNRANVPRVLGELMYFFEYRSTTIDLQLSHGFALPPNVAFIATMNTADRSIRSIDVALRRRFEIFECAPDASVLEAYYFTGRGENYVSDLLEGFTALNDELTAQLDKHHTIGDTFFMTEEMTAQRLQRIWLRKVSPLIEEYFFDAPDVASSFTLERFWPSVSAY